MVKWTEPMVALAAVLVLHMAVMATQMDFRALE
jgi:hypothetical protein